jgi:lipopolysaccharide transport system permease protein
MGGALLDLGRTVTRWRTWSAMAFQDIELRYRRSLIGPFWISASLIGMILALAYVYSAVFKTEFRDMIAHVATGQLAWSLLSAMILEGCRVVVEHGGQMANVPMPMTVAASRVVMRNFIIFLHNVVAVLLLLYLFGVPAQPIGYLAVFGAIIYIYLGFCLALILGPLCARFRDIRQVMESIVQAVFFVTPIFWMPGHASGRPIIIDANPFYHLIELIRSPLLGRYPSELSITYSAYICAVLGVLAIIVLSTTRKRVVLWV